MPLASSRSGRFRREKRSSCLPTTRIRRRALSYEVDLTKPVGQRIVNLQFHGKALDPAQTLRVAINNYRYTGGGGYSVYKGLPVLFRSPLKSGSS